LSIYVNEFKFLKLSFKLVENNKGKGYFWSENDEFYRLTFLSQFLMEQI